MAENYCVMTMAKRHRSDVKGLQAEANREYTDPSKYKNNVDPQRSAQNEYLVRSDDWQKSIDDVLQANGIKENRNSVVLITSVYGVSPEWFKEHSKDEAEQYFKQCLKYEQQTKGTVINAVIHKDESNWHMQVATVPIVQVQDVKCTPRVVTDKDGKPVMDKDGLPVIATYKSGKSKGKPIYDRTPVVDDQGKPVYHTGLNAKQVFGNRIAMSKRQTQFWEVCGKPFGMARGEIRVEDDQEAQRRLTEAEYKATQIVADASETVKETVKKAMQDAQDALKREREEFDKEREKWRTEASETAKTMQSALDDAKQAKADYDRAREGIKDTSDTFYARFESELKRVMSTYHYKSGKTVWEVNESVIKNAIQSAKMFTDTPSKQAQNSDKIARNANDKLSRGEMAVNRFNTILESIRRQDEDEMER